MKIPAPTKRSVSKVKTAPAYGPGRSKTVGATCVYLMIL